MVCETLLCNNCVTTDQNWLTEKVKDDTSINIASHGYNLVAALELGSNAKYLDLVGSVFTQI